MFRPAIGTAIGALIIAAALGMAAPAAAELPMSPVYRTDQSTASGKSAPRPSDSADHVDPAGKRTAIQSAPAAAPKPEKQTPTAKPVDAKPDSSPVVATAPIPPPPQPPSPAAEPQTVPSPTVAAEHAAAPPHGYSRAPRRHYAYSRYPYSYRYYSAGGASNPPHSGPNPYSPNGGD